MAAPATTLTEPAYNRLAAAHHEAGHAVVHAVSGGTVRSVRIDRHGGGVTDTDDMRPGQELAFLAMILAGSVAEARWLAANGHSTSSARAIARRDSADDLRELHAYCKRTGISQARAAREAEKLVGRHWSRIQRLAAKLDRSGRVSGTCI